MTLPLIALSLGVAAAQPAARPATLSAAVDAAVAASPALDAAGEKAREARAGLDEARLASLPRLTARSMATRGDDPVYAFGSLLEQKRFGPGNFAISALNDPGYLTNVKSGLDLGVPLFTGFALSDRRALGRLQVDAADAGTLATAQQARYQATEAFLRVLLGRELTASARERLAAAAAEIDEARRLKARGLVLGSDFYAAEALLGALQASRIRAEAELAAAQDTLVTLASAPLEASGALNEPDYSTAPASALVAAALSRWQDLRQAAAAESAAGVLARRERLSVLPSVDAFASIETNTSDFGSNPTNRLIGVRATLPVGDPAYFERGKRAAAARRAAAAGRRTLEQAVAVEVEQRLREYEAAAATVPVMKDAAEKARKSLELFRPLYREGRQSILDVLRAEQALLDARAGYLEALFRAHAGWARLQLAAGRLDGEATVEMDRRLGGAR